MKKADGLQRFITAQAGTYNKALLEIKKGKKRSHWMWYIFPQIQGLGFSQMSRLYAINDLQEAEEFLKDPVLGKRLVAICNALMELESNNANQIFGSPDDLKLQSCMTLFASLPVHDAVFDQVLSKFFKRKKDEKTLQILM
ncbi:MAG: DUF1810 domain-containing protein [Bacteroidota bacterium]|nr:DUF1810 domain-containing protein [Bacteroidota bacterium]